MKALFGGLILPLPEDLCWEPQRDPLLDWMRKLPSSISENEKEKSCFVFTTRPKRFAPTSRVSFVGPTCEQKELFHRLAEQWRRDVMFLSDTMERVMHPAYQRIIGMGAGILPLLLHEVAERHEHWFWALESITGEDPVNPEDSGDVPQISRAWVEWGRQRGHIR
jgi:hypothetical protein